MSKIKIGMAGVCNAGQLAKVFQYSKRAQIVALWDIDAQLLAQAKTDPALEAAQCYAEFDAFLGSDMDAVIFGTPGDVRTAQVIQALKAGKHVFNQGAMAHTVEDCFAIYETVKTTGMQYMLAENYVYLDFIGQWKKYVADGRIGNIHYAEAEYVQNLGDTSENVEAALQMSSHCIGPMLYLMGDDRIVKVTAWGKSGSNACGIQTALFETEQGRILKVLGSQTAKRDPKLVSYAVFGTTGSLETGRTPGLDTMGQRFFEGSDSGFIPMYCGSTKLYADLAMKKLSDTATAEYAAAETFLDAVEGNAEPVLNAERAVAITVPGILARQAAAEGYIWLDVPHI